MFWNLAFKELFQAFLISSKRIVSLARNLAHSMRQTTQACFGNVQIVCVLQQFYLYAQIASSGAGYLTQIDKVRIFQTVQGYHDF